MVPKLFFVLNPKLEIAFGSRLNDAGTYLVPVHTIKEIVREIAFDVKNRDFEGGVSSFGLDPGFGDPCSTGIAELCSVP